MISRSLAAIAFAMALLSWGCSPVESPSGEAGGDRAGTPDATAAHGVEMHGGGEGGLAWFDGTVDEAFQLAAETDKPLYLYWGAVWCPPCQEIKNTVFKSASFLGLSKLFIPVYIDGDSANAQRIGERFGVKGYPTMIVFNPAGEEVTRIPGGIEIERYEAVLELSLNHLQPVRQLIEGVLAEPGASLSEAQLTQLAFYSWGQDNGAVPEGEGTRLFAALAKKAEPYPVPGARLYMQSLLARHEEDEEARLPDAEAAAARARLTAILRQDELALAAWEYLTFYSVPLTELVGEAGAELRALRSLWGERTASLRTAPSLSTADRLAGWVPTIELAKEAGDDAELPPELLDQIRADVAWADERTTSPYARQSVMYMASGLLEEAGLVDEAEALLLAELSHSKSPYYFMSVLAGLAEDRGDVEGAVNWFERAYRTSTGPATRLQWGASYVRGLLRLQPERHELVAGRSLGLLADVEDDLDLFSGRNFRVLRRLAGALEEWQQEEGNASELRTAAMRPFFEQIAARCSELDAQTRPGSNCRELVTL